MKDAASIILASMCWTTRYCSSRLRTHISRRRFMRVIYELLEGDVATSCVYVLMQTAVCMRNIGELRYAAEVYEHDPTNNDAQIKLAEIL
ncbi:hypothetical protein BJ165DRAFT_335113 [Panaeolus papilionaceus]|nr:hypothetical protein BJ165DRAFT_335113 [Panaeolus papilionaceus]